MTEINYVSNENEQEKTLRSLYLFGRNKATNDYSLKENVDVYDWAYKKELPIEFRLELANENIVNYPLQDFVIEQAISNRDYNDLKSMIENQSKIEKELLESQEYIRLYVIQNTVGLEKEYVYDDEYSCTMDSEGNTDILITETTSTTDSLEIINFSKGINFSVDNNGLANIYLENEHVIKDKPLSEIISEAKMDREIIEKLFDKRFEKTISDLKSSNIKSRKNEFNAEKNKEEETEKSNNSIKNTVQKVKKTNNLAKVKKANKDFAMER